MTYIVLIIGLAGLLMAWYTKRQNAELSERIAQVNSRVYHLRQNSQEKQAELQEEVLKLRYEILRMQGSLRVTDTMTLDEIALVHPQARQVLGEFHIGGCMSCAVDGHQTLSEVMAVNGREIEPILLALNNLAQENVAISEEKIRPSNIELVF